MYKLYREPLTQASISDTGQSTEARLAEAAILQETADVSHLGTGAGDLQISVGESGQYAERYAVALSELIESATIETMPFSHDEGQTSLDGYYAVSNVSRSALAPQSNRFQDVEATLVKEGTRRSHWRTVETSKDSRANDFGSDETTRVGVPADASLVRWWDGSTTVSYPTSVATHTGEFGDIAVYDVDAAPVDNPILVYDLDYFEQGLSDVKVWDTYGEASKTDADTTVAWASVYSTEHDPREDAALVIENGLLRLMIDDDAETIAAEEWDAGSDAWSSVSLGASDWAPVDLDVQELAPARVRARLLFSDGSSRYPLDCILTRGDTAGLFVRVPNASGPTPAGLVDLLEPIAATTIYDSGGTLGLIKRSEVPA